MYKGPGKGFTSLPEWQRVGDKIVEKGRKQNGPLAAKDEEVKELVAAIDGISVEPDDRIDQQELVRIQNEAESIEDGLFAVHKQLQDERSRSAEATAEIAMLKLEVSAADVVQKMAEKK